MRLPPLTAGQGLTNLAVWFRGSAPATGIGPISVSDIECIRERGWSTLYCLACPLIWSGCIEPV